MNKTDVIEQSFLRSDIPDFRPGDTVKVHVHPMGATFLGLKRRDAAAAYLAFARFHHGIDIL